MRDYGYIDWGLGFVSLWMWMKYGDVLGTGDCDFSRRGSLYFDERKSNTGDGLCVLGYSCPQSKQVLRKFVKFVKFIHYSSSTEHTNDDDDPSNQSQKLTSGKSNRQITDFEAVDQFLDSFPEPPLPPSPQKGQRATSNSKEQDRGEMEVGNHAMDQYGKKSGTGKTSPSESSKVHLYNFDLPPARSSYRKWTYKSRAAAKKEEEELLSVQFEIQFKRDVKFHIWPELVKGKDLTADSKEGKNTLVRAHRFVHFYYTGEYCSIGIERSLRKCLEWFENWNDGSYYNQYLKDRALQSLPDT
ncbi:hypothetical protein EAF00_005291 [Botryotinia globosa]|nr:hypothetical protein EAF00_005291 [Botryotinia globosa]